jgi:hypothetical protein
VRGFTLLEVLISLVLLMLALALAAQILLETSQVLTEAAAEQLDAPIPLAVARLRGDVLGSAAFTVVEGPRGEAGLLLEGHPAGTILYERAGDELRRTLLDPGGAPLGEGVLMRGVTGWSCIEVGPRLVAIEIRYRRRTVRPSPLSTLPAFRGPRTKERTESLLLALRGAGLGDSW